MFKSIYNKLKNNIYYFLKINRKYKVGSFSIYLPYNHTLPAFQKNFQLYDKNIGILTSIVFKNFPKSLVIDIGANVGDTAAEVRAKSEIEIIAIEGNNKFIPYLEKNSLSLGNITVIKSFVGTSADSILSINTTSGTSRLIEQENGNNKHLNSNNVTTNSLESLLKEANIDLNKISTIKIDTDGYDFKIILANKKIITKFNPIFYFEYDLTFRKDAGKEANEVIQLFLDNNYSFVVFDNFGNLMSAKEETNFSELNNYIKSCRCFGGGARYLDVVAFSKKFNNVKKEFLKNNIQFINDTFYERILKIS